MRLLLALLFTARLCATEVEIGPKENSLSEEVHEISMLMATVEAALRDDRHDRPVQLDIRETIERMERLIKNCEEEELRHGRAPLEDSKLQTKNNGVDRPNNRDSDPWDKTVWAQLPRAMRGEIVQVWAVEMPLKWRQRITAYILSVNAAQGKPQKK